MISYAYARTHAYAYLQTDIRICGHIIIRIVYNEPNALPPSYFNQNEKTHFNDAQLGQSLMKIAMMVQEIWSGN